MGRRRKVIFTVVLVAAVLLGDILVARVFHGNLVGCFLGGAILGLPAGVALDGLWKFGASA